LEVSVITDELDKLDAMAGSLITFNSDGVARALSSAAAS
jgi:hypothetical protein